MRFGRAVADVLKGEGVSSSSDFPAESQSTSMTDSMTDCTTLLRLGSFK